MIVSTAKERSRIGRRPSMACCGHDCLIQFALRLPEAA